MLHGLEKFDLADADTPAGPAQGCGRGGPVLAAGLRSAKKAIAPKEFAGIVPAKECYP